MAGAEKKSLITLAIFARFTMMPKIKIGILHEQSPRREIGGSLSAASILGFSLPWACSFLLHASSVRPDSKNTRKVTGYSSISPSDDAGYSATFLSKLVNDTI